MLDQIHGSIFNIPLWVILLLLILILLAYQAAKPKIVPVKYLLYSPIFYFLISFFVIFHFLPLDNYNIAMWVLSFVLGSTLGWIQLRDLKVRGIRNTKTIYMPGSWYVTCVVVFLVLLKVYFNFRFSQLNIKIFLTPRYTLFIMALYGFMSGLIIGRIAHAYKCVHFGPYTELDEVKTIIKNHRLFKRKT